MGGQGGGYHVSPPVVRITRYPRLIVWLIFLRSALILSVGFHILNPLPGAVVRSTDYFHFATVTVFALCRG